MSIIYKWFKNKLKKDKYNYNIFLLRIYGKENNIRNIHVDIHMDEKMLFGKVAMSFLIHESLR